MPMGERLRQVGAVTGLLIAILLVCHAHASAYAAYGVGVEPAPPRSAQPGDLVTHVFTVENTGTQPDEYTLDLTPPAGWSPLPIADRIDLAPGESSRLFVTVMIPPGAEAGTYTTELRATSVNDPSQWGTAEGIVDLLPTVDLVLETVRVDRAQPGTEARHVIRVRNAGNVADTYRIEARATPTMTVRASPTEFTVLPGEQRDVTITVLIPTGAAPGSSYRVRVEATSHTDPTLARTLWISAAVSPPPPEEVPVDLYPELPLTLRLSLTDTTSPTLRLSIAGDIPQVGRITGTISLSDAKLTNPAAGLRTPGWGVEWGHVSVAGAFTSISGRGLGVQWHSLDWLTTQAVLVRAGQGLAGSLEWEGLMLRGVTTYTTVPRARIVGEFQLSGRLGDHFSLGASFARSLTEEGSSDAFRIRPSLRVEELAGSLEMAKVSPGFPGQTPRRSFTWNLSLGRGITPVQGTFSTTNTVALTDIGPPQVRTTTEEFTGSASLRLSDRTNVSFSLNMETKESDDVPPDTDEGSQRVRLTLTNRGPVIVWSLTGTRRVLWDDVRDSRVVATGGRISARARLGQLTWRGTYDLDYTEERLGEDQAQVSSSLSLNCSLPAVPLAPSFGLAISEGRTTLSASITWTDVAGWSLNASIEKPLAPDSGFSLSAAFTHPIPFPLFGPTYGAIRGRAFVDVDGTGRFSPGDQPVAELLLVTDVQQANTGRDGRFAFFPVLPGTYEVKIEDLPFGLRPLVELPIRVTIRAGQEVELLIPLESKSLIRGTVFHDLDQDGRRDPGEPGVSGVELLIRNAAVRETVRTDAAGRYAVEVPAGTYTVELLPESLPSRFEPTTPTDVQARVEERAFATADFGIWQRPRPVVVEPIAPIARFQYEPTVPRVGQEVTFDAADSRAMGDERIVSYAWEFRMGPHLIETRGEKVTVIFDHPGTWLVTLRVTDSAGQTSQSQRTVTVR